MDAQKLPTFFFMENKNELPGAGLILSTADPFYIARVLKFRTDSEAETFESKHNPAGFIKVGMYNIYLLMLTRLSGMYSLADRVKPLLHDMAEFYTTEKIKTNESYHKRYLTGRN